MKALLSNADSIVDSIDRYLAKADDDLEKALKAEGFAEPGKTVEQIEALEKQIAEALQKQTEELVEALSQIKQEEMSEEEQQKILVALFAVDMISESVQQAALDMFEMQIPELATIYMQESDGELVVETLRERTSNWIQSWSERLGELTKISTHQQIASLIEDTVSSGVSITDLTRKIQEGGWRSEYYQARRFALTETLRAHSVAREEAIQQSPAVEEKEWKHTGSHKNEPRSNHVAMDGQIVSKSEPFVLIGKNGITYYPMYPRDSTLPASESVNCHCIHRGIVRKEVLGLSYEERKKLQQECIQNDDAAWQEEKNVSYL